MIFVEPFNKATITSDLYYVKQILLKIFLPKSLDCISVIARYHRLQIIMLIRADTR